MVLRLPGISVDLATVVNSVDEWSIKGYYGIEFLPNPLMDSIVSSMQCLKQAMY